MTTADATMVTQQDTFNQDKDVTIGMTVLVRTEDDEADQSGWKRPWSLALVDK